MTATQAQLNKELKQNLKDFISVFGKTCPKCKGTRTQVITIYIIPSNHPYKYGCLDCNIEFE